MALRMSENFFIYNEHHAVQKNMIGNAVILLWFFFDSIGNLIQMYIGAHLLEWSGAICNDVQMHHLENQAKLGRNATSYQDKYELGKLKMEFIKLPVEVLGNKADLQNYMHISDTDAGDKLVVQIKERWEKENEEADLFSPMKKMMSIDD